MSVAWQGIRDTIKTWAKTASGLKAAVWREEERPYVDGPLVLLNVLLTAANGVDETRWDTNLGAPAGQEVTPRQVGLRRFTCSMAVENLVSQRPVQFADHFVERLRTRLRRPSTHDTFRAAGIAVVGSSAIRVLDYDFDGRRVSAASMDVVMAASVDETDTPTGYIAKVRLSSTLQDVNGVVLPVPPNLSNLEIP